MLCALNSQPERTETNPSHERLIEGNENKRLTSRERAALLLDLLDDKFSTPFSDLVTTRPYISCAKTAGDYAP